MTRFYILLVSLMTLSTALGQVTNPGDIAFTAFNADGDDDFAIVALIDLPPNTIIYFTDNEPSSATTLADTNEGIIRWDTGVSIINSGTVVTFTDTDSGGNPNFGASLGTLEYESGTLNLAAEGDAIYAYVGSSPTAITGWLAGIQNAVGNDIGIEFTSLTTGSTFIDFFTSGSPDGGFYSATRNSEAQFSDYLTLLGNNANWTTEPSNGELILPISTTAFTISGSSTDTVVEFVGSSAGVAEDAGTYDLAFTILNEDFTNDTSFELVLTSGEATDIDNYTTQTVTFPAGSTANQIVTIGLTDDVLDEPDETFTFEIQNVVGGNNAVVGLNSSFDLTIFASDTAGMPIIVYDADFSNNGDGFPAHTTSSPPSVGPVSAGPFGTAPNQWSLSYETAPSTDATENTFEVVLGELQSADWGGQGIFTSQVIDVTDINTVTISATGVNSGANDNNFTYFYIIDGSNRVETPILSNDGDSVNYSIAGLDVSGASTLEVGFEFSENGADQGYTISEFLVSFAPITYTYNGTWAPNDPNGLSNSFDHIVIASGDAVISETTDINRVTVNPGTSLTINTGVTLTLADASNGLTLESSSSSFSSLITNGTIVGTVHYERFVNQIGQSGVPGGNDLIAAPLGAGGAGPFGLNFQSFLGFGNPANNTLIASQSNIYAFAPYNTSTAAFENISFDFNNPPPPANQPTIEAGKGYRVATFSGANLTFTGDPLTGEVPIAIDSPANGSPWNLIGNPYPSYISSTLFLSTNSGILDDTILDPEATAIYGYNSGTYTGSDASTAIYTIINANSNSNLNIAPGQGFFVASNATGGDIFFTEAMRTTTGSDDFIEGRSASPNHKFILELTAEQTYNTSFYFNANSTRGLDPGYDAAAFGDNASTTPIYSHLVQDNTGRAMAIQSLGDTDFNDISIPLGVNANQGIQLRFSIGENTLPSTVEVYMEDQIANTLTLLNTSDYVFTPSSNLSGTGRFFLRFIDSSLGTANNPLDLINIFTDNRTKTLVVAGQLETNTSIVLYDLQGRLILQKHLNSNSTSHSVAMGHLSTGVYVVELQSQNRSRIQKIILK
jgi:hypothetical protein